MQYVLKHVNNFYKFLKLWVNLGNVYVGGGASGIKCVKVHLIYSNELHLLLNYMFYLLKYYVWQKNWVPIENMFWYSAKCIPYEWMYKISAYDFSTGFLSAHLIMTS